MKYRELYQVEKIKTPLLKAQLHSGKNHNTKEGIKKKKKKRSTENQ